MLRLNLIDLLARDEFENVRTLFNTRKFSRDQLIYQPYEDENLVFIVKTGRVRVFISCDEKEFTIAMLNPGDIYSTHTRAFVQAMEPVELLVTGVHTIRRELAAVPELTRAMVHVLGDMLKNSFHIIESFAFKDVTRRLVEWMLREARDAGIQKDNGVEIRPNLTMEELSKMMGASRQTVSTQINTLVRQGLVEKSGRGTYLIPDPKSLENLLIP